MPTISIFFGIVIQMHWRDHAPPHFHAWYQGREAMVSIETGEVLQGKLPKAAKRLLRDWTKDNRAGLLANWARGARREPFEMLPGADQ